MLMPDANYGDPSTPAEALSFCDALLDAPAAMRVRAGERHRGIFHWLNGLPRLISRHLISRR